MAKKILLLVLTVALLTSLFILPAQAEDEDPAGELPVEDIQTEIPAEGPQPEEIQIEEITAGTLGDPAPLNVTYDGSSVSWPAFAEFSSISGPHLYFTYFRIEDGVEVSKTNGNSGLYSTDGSGSRSLPASSLGRGTWVIAITITDDWLNTYAQGKSAPYTITDGAVNEITSATLNIDSPAPGQTLPSSVSTSIDSSLHTSSIQWYASDSPIDSSVIGNASNQITGIAPDGKYLAAVVRLELWKSGDVTVNQFAESGFSATCDAVKESSVYNIDSSEKQWIEIVLYYGLVKQSCTVHFELDSWFASSVDAASIPADFSIDAPTSGKWVFTLPASPVPAATDPSVCKFLYYEIDGLYDKVYVPGEEISVDVENGIVNQTVTVRPVFAGYTDYSIYRTFYGVKPEDLANSSYTLTIYTYPTGRADYFGSADMSGFVHTLSIKNAEINVDSDGQTYATWIFNGLESQLDSMYMPYEESGNSFSGYYHFTPADQYEPYTYRSFELFSTYFRHIDSLNLVVTAPEIGKNPDYSLPSVQASAGADATPYDFEWYYYDSAAGSWVDVPADSKFEAGKAYNIYGYVDVYTSSVGYNRHGSLGPILSSSAPVLNASAPALDAPVLGAPGPGSPAVFYYMDKDTKVSVNGTAVPFAGSDGNGWVGYEDYAFYFGDDSLKPFAFSICVDYTFPVLKEKAPTTPLTGDDSRPGLWCAAMVFSAAALGAGVYLNGRKKKSGR